MTEQPSSTPHRVGFFARIFALVIDYCILAGPLFALGYLFFDFAVALGNWGRVVGLIVGGLYFTLLNGRPGNGQTPGKRLMRLRVIGPDGQPPALPQSSGRTLVLLAPLLLNGLDYTIDGTPMWLIPLLGVLIFGGWLGLTYYYLFNIRSRRVLHDYLFQTEVVWKDLPTPATALRPAPRWLHAIFAVLIVMITIVGSYNTYLLVSKASPGFEQIAQIQRSLSQDPAVRFATAQIGTSWTRTGTNEQSQAQSFIQIIVRPAVSLEEFQAALPRLYARLKKDAPFVQQAASLNFTIRRGFDFGIARINMTTNESHSIAEWETMARSVAE